MPQRSFNNNGITQERLVRARRLFDDARTAELGKALRHLGADAYDFLVPETAVLIKVIRTDEQILGIVYGRYKQKSADGIFIGRGALIATDKRILLLDKKPLYLNTDEIAYYVVSGVDYTRVGPVGTVVLHTRVGDIQVRTFNRKCAESFVSSVESMIFEQNDFKPQSYADQNT